MRLKPTTTLTRAELIKQARSLFLVVELMNSEQAEEMLADQSQDILFFIVLEMDNELATELRDLHQDLVSLNKAIEWEADDIDGQKCNALLAEFAV